MKRVFVADLIESDEAGFACSKARLVESGLPHLRPFNIGSDGALDLTEVYQVDPSEAPKGKGQLLAGDILFNNTNSAELVGKSAVVTTPMTAGFSNHLTRVRVDRNLVDPFWLSLWLRKLQASGYFTANATQWVSQAAYRTSDLGKLPIDLPSLSQQRTAVDLLSRAEGIVRLRREAQQKAAELIPAIFVDMFGDPATNPKGLAVVTLGDVLASADYGSSSKASDADIGLPMIRMGNVDFSGNVDLSDLKYVDLPPNEVVKFGLKDGDILFNRTNSKELVGKTGLWIGDREAILASYFIRLRVCEQRARPFFVWAFMNTPHMKRVLFETARGAIGQANINSRELRAFQIPLPAFDEQARFESRCRDVLVLRRQQGLALDKAEAGFQALLARAFAAASKLASFRGEALA